MSNEHFIYVLPEYTNEENLKNIRSQTEDAYSVVFNKIKGFQIELRETNSLVEEEYCLNLKSAKFVVEGTEVKESMIHHHKKGHISRHLQFKLQARNETIRISLENLDIDDYVHCIKGFLHISQDLIQKEQEDNNIEENLCDYFFNSKIGELSTSRTYLLEKIRESSKFGQIIDETNTPLDDKKLSELKKETHLLPFLDW
jgi:hypothetical protein